MNEDDDTSSGESTDNQSEIFSNEVVIEEEEEATVEEEDDPTEEKRKKKRDKRDTSSRGTKKRRLLQQGNVMGGLQEGDQLYILSNVTPNASGTPPQPQSSQESIASDIGEQVEDLVNQLQEVLGITSEGQSTDPLWNTLFWTAIILAGVVILHIALRLLVVWRKIPMPGVLAWPRMELACVQAVLPLVIAAGAKLYQGNSASQLAAAIIFAAVLPALLLAAATYLVLKHLALCPPRDRKAHYVAPEKKVGRLLQNTETVDSDDLSNEQNCGSIPDKESSSDEAGPTPSARQEGEITPQQRIAPPTHIRSQSELRKPLTRREKFKLYSVRYLLKPVFGFDPDEMGEWVSTTQTEESFVNRWGVLFDSSQGPPIIYEKGTFEWDPASKTYIRYTPREIPPENRLQQAKLISQLLATIVTTFKMCLFINLLAAFGSDNGPSPLTQVILLLVLTVVYWMYMRFLVPICDIVDLSAEVIATLCDAGTFISGIVLITTSAENTSQIVNLGWSMLVFQLVGLLANVLVPVLKTTAFVLEVGVSLLLKRNSPSSRFSQVVRKAMKTNPDILLRKYADRWLVKVHGRGLNDRMLAHFERSASVLPFSFSNTMRRTRTLGTPRKRDENIPPPVHIHVETDVL